MAKRLIDIAPYENMVDAATCQIHLYRSGDGYCDVMSFKTANIPTVDAVEVVRCKDCKHWGYPCICEVHSGWPDQYSPGTRFTWSRTISAPTAKGAALCRRGRMYEQGTDVFQQDRPLGDTAVFL